MTKLATVYKEVQLIDPTATELWDNYILAHGNCTFYHSSAWSRALSESYGYVPFFFSIISHGVLEAAIPCLEVNSMITGRRVVSLPFSDFCEPIVSDLDTYRYLIDYIIEFGKKAGWRTAEFRAGNPLPGASVSSARFLRHILDLSRKEEVIFDSLRDATKRNIRKAEKAGVRITMSTTETSLDRFYRLNCMTRKEHGLPPQPSRFFKNLLKHVIGRGLGTIILASHEEKTIAGAIFCHFNKKAVYKYGASDRKYQHLRGNNLVMWEAIKKYCREGCHTLDFGRSEPESTGLLQFKRGWGSEEMNFKYYKYDFRTGSFVVDPPKVTGIHNNYFRKMPIPLLKVAGSLLYRHVG